MRFFLTLLFLFNFSCGNPQRKALQECKQPKYVTAQQIKRMLDDQVEGRSKKNIHVIFSASWCASCKQLRKLLRDAAIENQILFVDVDKTWGFLFSKQVGVKGIPTLVIIKKDQAAEKRDNMNKILIYLLANVNNKNE